MSLIFVDGFDYYTTADLAKKWTSVTADGSSTFPTVVTPGRYGSGTGCLKLGIRGTAGVAKGITPRDNFIVGFAFKQDTLLPFDIYLVWCNSDATTPFQQGRLVLNNGVLKYVNGQLASYNQTSLTTITPGVWYYLEFKLKIATSVGANETQVRLNGVTVINVPAGTNTRGDYLNGVNTTDRINISGAASSGTNTNIYVDDLYFADSAGTFNNAFLGDVRIETIYPDGAGSSTQFTPLSGTNWSQVSETPEDGDTSYVSSATPTFKDIYTLGDLSSSPTSIYGIQISTIARKDDAGGRVLAPIVKSGGTEYDHQTTNAFGLADAYTQHLDIWEKNPDGTIVWDYASINALNTGFKIIS